MSDRLPIPVRRVLRDPLDASAVEAARRRLALRPRRASPWRLGLATAAALAVGALVVALVRGAGAGPQPLRLDDGRAIPALLTQTDTTEPTIAFDEGSQVHLDDASTLRLLQNDASEIGLLLEHGVVTFDVRPGGARRWTIECGLATVVVVGTRFTIERSRDRVMVAVERGAVLVRGERVPDRARRIGAGERIEIVDAPTEVAVAEVAPTEPEMAPEAEAPRERVSPPVRTSPTWQTDAAAGRWDDAWTTLGAPGVERASRSASVDELLALADVARLSGHPSVAVVPLQRIVSAHRDDPSAALAAFSLGRVEDQLEHHDRAARAFETALSLALPSSLRPDALARLATAHQRAGAEVDARAAAAQYLAESPEGRHAGAMRAIGASR